MIKKIFSQYSGLKKSAYVLFIARLVTSMGSFIWPMLTLILSIKLGYSESKIALIFLILAFIFFPATLIGGKLADRFNKKKIIIIFDIITVTFFFLSAIVEPGIMMLIFFTIAGLFATMEGPSHEALVVEASLPKDREKIYSLTYLGHNLGFIIGAGLGGFLITNHLSLAFIIDGITTLMSTILIIMFVFPIKQEDIEEDNKNEYESEENHKDGLKVLKNRKPILLFILITMITAFVYDQWVFIIPLYMTDIFGDINGPLFYGFIASFNGIMVIAATPIITYLTRGKSEMPKIIIGTFLFSISFLLVMYEPILITFFSFVFLFTIGEVLKSISTGPYVSRRIPSSHRGRINSYVGLSSFTGIIVGKVMIGLVIDLTGYNTALITIVILGIIATLLTMINYKMDKKTFPNLYKNKA